MEFTGEAVTRNCVSQSTYITALYSSITTHQAFSLPNKRNVSVRGKNLVIAVAPEQTSRNVS